MRLTKDAKGAEPTGWLPLNQRPKAVGSSNAGPEISGQFAIDNDMRTWWQPAKEDKTPTLTTTLTSNANVP